jgi:dTDP-4-amino-4,6-dideoxygalactose transaminase
MKTRSIPLFKVYMSKNASVKVAEVLDSGFIGEGPQVKAFEQDLTTFFKVYDESHDIITVNSATSAEHLIYHMLKSERTLCKVYPWGSAQINWPGMEPTDVVLSTALTCTATNWPIIHNGLNLRWVDVDPLTLNMSAEALEETIDENTRIVTIVHWGGNPADMDAIESVIHRAEKKYGRPIAIVEDCAHSFGGKYKNGQYIGFRGNFATFSLQAIKHITSVDGGFIVSPYSTFTQEAKLLRWYGIDREGPRADFRCEADILEAGFKFHMNDVSAAVGRANLNEADAVLSAYISNAEFYNKELRGVKGVTLIPQQGNPAYWLYTIHTERRDDFMHHMSANGIATSRVHERNDNHTCTSKYKTHLPGVDEAVSTMVSIPVGFWVSKEDRKYIVDVIKKGW